MTDNQLHQKLCKLSEQTIWIYRTTYNNGDVLLILNYNGHELARKEYNLRTAGWDDVANPKVWLYPLPDDALCIDVQPLREFLFHIAMSDF
ncbi:hypothetical protein [Leclercia adecarboxylata]|uniref:hypothetical protein n=1 Tax=Leclercia adecarboxylata TaxID=83655 RepID=UPI00294A11A0|nr:hypothetical protein [Leclercia adecarboxylata]MDV5280158.1 hypothetical protein [Leclercia adecarboxylata]